MKAAEPKGSSGVKGSVCPGTNHVRVHVLKGGMNEIMSKIDGAAELIGNGKAQEMPDAVQEALDKGCCLMEILKKCMIDPMGLAGKILESYSR